MVAYQQSLWGYQLDIPDNWVHRSIQDAEGFAPNPEALEPGFEGTPLGHILIRGEWNSLDRDIQPLWNEHITRLSIMIGAKKLGSAPWIMAGGHGFEAEIQLSKKSNKRLWSGILEINTIVLHFMVLHWKEEREWFEPLATALISSLRFIQKADGISLDDRDLPIPPEYKVSDPKLILEDLQDTTLWKAYEGTANIGALQAFYLRELPNHGWEIEEYVPSPYPSAIDFSRFKIKKDNKNLTLGLMPLSKMYEVGAIVIKNNSYPGKDPDQK